MGKAIKAKKSCCKSRERCKRCPVVCKRLEKLGYAERHGKRQWSLVVIPPQARARRRARPLTAVSRCAGPAATDPPR